jgi:hypothetical protein
VAVIVIGLIRSHPVVPPVHNLPSVAETVGVLLLLKAFASGCSALTGVEAIANAVPEFRQPRARRAQHTEMWLGIILGAMLLGLAVLIRKFDVTPSTHITVLAQMVRASVGQGIAFYVIQLITMVLLVLAANTSFGGLPVLASLVARDNYLPHIFGLKGERQVYRFGVLVLAVAAAALLVVVRGDTQALVPLFAIGVFVGFTLSQVGMVRHWYSGRQDGWAYRAAINGFGAVLTFVAIVIELISKFTQGAWLVVLVIPAMVVLFTRVHRAYDQMGALLELGKMPPPPHPEEALVIVPVAGLSRLTEEAISAAMSLGEEVVAIYVCFDDPEGAEAEEEFRQSWSQWGPDVPLITLHSHHRSLGPPVVEYLRTLEDEDSARRLVVLIAEMEPTRPWEWVLHNQRGVVLDRAIKRGTANVVVCRLRFRPANWTDVVRSGAGG